MVSLRRCFSCSCLFKVARRLRADIGEMFELLSLWSSRLVLETYRWCPFKSLLDAVYLRSALLQSLFCYRIRLPPPLRECTKMEDFTRQCGLQAESHDVVTADGYHLMLFRLKRRRGGGGQGRQVLLFHGLMQDCESFLVGGRDSLAAVLALDSDSDVWLANARCNKYSQRHSHLSSQEDKFWQVSLDELVSDVEVLVDHVLSRGVGRGLVCIGFSQGSAQLCGALSSIPTLNLKLSLLVCLAPAVKPGGLAPSTLISAIQSRPALMSFLFGRRALFSSVFNWQSILSPSAFAWTCVHSMRFLFGWSCAKISERRRATLFQSIYSPAPVRTILHWFQNIQLRRFGAFRNAAPYDFSLITCPVAILSGSLDTLILPSALRDAVGERCIMYHIEKDYEHLDLIWADDAKEHIFNRILKLIDESE